MGGREVWMQGCRSSRGAVLQDWRQPLHLASHGGHTELSEMLVAKGALVDAKDVVSAYQKLHGCGHGACMAGCIDDTRRGMGSKGVWMQGG